MLRAVFALARVALLVRCLFSIQARQELRDYVKEARWWDLALDIVAAVFGLFLVGAILFGLYNTAIVFYNIATTGRAEP